VGWCADNIGSNEFVPDRNAAAFADWNVFRNRPLADPRMTKRQLENALYDALHSTSLAYGSAALRLGDGHFRIFALNASDQPATAIFVPAAR
jgi:hypothetical protein